MLPSKTVFVVGAGASAEVGLPVGQQLKNIISDKLNFSFDHWKSGSSTGDQEILRSIERRYSDPTERNACFKACRKIRDGVMLSGSIDDFVDAHQHDSKIAECAKLAIAQSILEAEKASTLYVSNVNTDDTINVSALANTWYLGFFELISRQLQKSDLDKIFENVTVVCFNYDRCIEHFLVHALAIRYAVPREHAAALVQSLRIYHPYGVVGPYFLKDSAEVRFGSERLPSMVAVAKNIRTYTEQHDDVDALESMRVAVGEANVMVFLGSAFHENNIELMLGKQDTGIRKRVYGTRLGISDADLNVVKHILHQLSDKKYESHFDERGFDFCNEVQTCNQLFDRYRLSLSR